MLVTGRLSLGPFWVPKKELAKPGPGLDGIHEEPPPGTLVTLYSVWESTSTLRGIIQEKGWKLEVVLKVEGFRGLSCCACPGGGEQDWTV